MEGWSVVLGEGVKCGFREVTSAIESGDIQ